MVRAFLFEYKFNNTTCNSNQEWNNNTYQCECINCCTCEKDYSWNPSKCICENSKYMKSITDASVIECDQIITILDIISTIKTNTIATNAVSTASINCHSIKVRDYYILHTLVLAAILLLIIITICYHYAKQKVQYKMNELKKVCIKNRTCYYFDDIIRLEDFHLDNILLDEKSQENILIYEISYKTLIGSKLLQIRFDKIDGIIRIHDRTRYLTLFGTKKYDASYNTIRYLVSMKKSIAYLLFSLFCKN